ncbi:MAG: DNA repair protein RadA [Caldisericia bacterium]|nr:DNA repair protein RadA [Caldisericia bacterium]
MKNKVTTLYKCKECGYTSPGKMGKCPECGGWGTFEQTTIGRSQGFSMSTPISAPVPLTEINNDTKKRYSTNLTEVDRVLGGGIVPGSVILVGGEPGIGKSTLLLQIADSLLKEVSKASTNDINKTILYASGEESPSQIKLRANRLSISNKNLLLTFETEISSIQQMVKEYDPCVLIVDSIQTVYTNSIEGTAGSISQIRETTQILVNLAKRNNITVFIVGHVTKDGNIAGPKFLEHLVDVVLYIEGEKNSIIRMLRSNKNRFGETGELGILSMKEKGLMPVSDPSEVFLGKLDSSRSGTLIFPSLEGIRTLFLEIQALCTQSFTPVPRRVISGSDFNRTIMLAAILEKRIGVSFIGLDYFVNVTGGSRINDPAADLAISIALLSSRSDIQLPSKLVAFGEVGLSGEIRPVVGAEKRIQEAQQRKFFPIFVPSGSISKPSKNSSIIEISHINEIVEKLK